VLVAASVCVSAHAAAPAPDTDARTRALEQQVKALSQQLQAIQAKLDAMNAAPANAASVAPGAATSVAAPGELPQLPPLNASPPASFRNPQQGGMAAAGGAYSGQVFTRNLPHIPGSPPAMGSPFGKLSIGGYGEVEYSRPIHYPSQTEATLRRAVLGFGYAFNDTTQFVSEFEMENAIASASDAGEFEVEQFYVDHQLTDWAAVKGGLFLMPFGLLNQVHEPTRYYGVHRNFVETLIIPSTWREGGIGFHGQTRQGLLWDLGLTTGVNFNKWSLNPENPLDLIDVAPLQATHQELSNADASHLSEYLSLSYVGTLGLDVGASIVTGTATQFDPQHNPKVPRVTLWEAHGRWNPGRFDFSALYARGTISNTGSANALFPGASNPIPSAFYGYYAQAAYTAWQRGGYRFAPFVRWSRFNLGAGYDTDPAFPTPRRATDRVWTLGANFWINPRLVIKADYQAFSPRQTVFIPAGALSPVSIDETRWDLGMGLTF
jgi:Phosphate-selective porin